MLLVLDVANTNTVLGVFTRAKADAGRTAADKSLKDAPRYDQLLANWRVATVQTSTVDEYGGLFRNLFAMAGLEVSGMHGIVISSVVQPLDPVLRQVCERYFNSKPLFIEPGIKTGMPVHYDNPAEVGADRIVNAVAAGGGSQTRASHRLDDCGQFAVRALLRVPRLGGWHSQPFARRVGTRHPSSCHSRHGLADPHQIEIHQDGRRLPHPRGPAHYLGAECDSTTRDRKQADGEDPAQRKERGRKPGPFHFAFQSLGGRGKLLQLFHRN